MSDRLSRRRLLMAAAALPVATLAAPHVARASTRRWRCVTSWARTMPGPGVSARRLAEAITTMSDGALTIDVFAAGELVPGLQVFDAVSTGSIELAHTASLFWGGKIAAAPMFTTWPFGLSPEAHVGWLSAGGQAMWDQLYEPFGVRAFVAGNTGPSAAGWFRKPITSADEFKGLRIRATGLGGEVYAALGATAVAIPPADTYAALERGVIDAVELLAPANDEPAGFGRIARHLVFPGFNKPNGASELLINAAAFRTLPAHLQAVVEAACRAEHDRALGETIAANAAALARLRASGVAVTWLDGAALTVARQAASTVMDRLAGTSSMAGRIVTHARAYAHDVETWERLRASTNEALRGAPR